MEQLRLDLQILEKRFADIKKTLDEVHTAIVGNPLMQGSGGIASRLLEAEEKVESLEEEIRAAERRFEKRLSETEKKQIKYNIQTGIMWACLGGVAMAIFMYILQLKK